MYLLELGYLPILLAAGLVMRLYRRAGSQRLPLSTYILRKIGIFPIRDHYYEPLFNTKHLQKSLRQPRSLPGIDFNEGKQLELLEKFNYRDEFRFFVESESLRTDKHAFSIEGNFASGDADFLFNFIRYTKPERVIEIGCGESTKIIQKAIAKNATGTPSTSAHICIEPYEQPWLECYPDIELIREKVENIDLKMFENLRSGDFLFIDSSHIIRPQGDVLHEYLSIIPSLTNGVVVHVHDIFSPRDYLDYWIKDQVLFWNEQYLLEALLTQNDNYEIIAALNFLHHKYPNELKAVCPYLSADREPGSFYFRVK
tara:strand:- start:199 stop:1137 length:939 start_codon:yes stop_codon:yes gene_type:complete